tara:strand:+ start:215 stop:1480 length:1266 start_codon:yes stop_codon:yes gene_type:complete
MGSIKKALKPVTRVIDDIIPNEIKPALPYIAATFGAPYLTPFVGKGLAGLGMKALSNSALQAGLTKGLAGGLANIGTQALLGKKINPTSALFSAATVGGGQFLKDSPFFQDSKFAKSVGEFISPDKLGGMNLKEASAAATTPLTAGTAESAYDAAKKANEEYEQYLADQQAAGAEDIQTRVDYITRYMSLAGFDQDNIDTTLNELGYAANGGLMGTRVGFKNGGDVGTLGDSMQQIKILLMKNEILSAGGGGFGGKDLDDKTDDEIIKIHEDLFGQDKANGGLMATRVGFEQGGDTMMARDDRIGTLFNLLEAERMAGDNADLDLIKEYEAELFELLSPRKTAAEGGIMDLKMGGMPAEMDLRGGGFVPIGAKEKADDVPARLSKNEFVMTADAVRAAGGGSVNKGAKRMYDLMNNLEARV